MGKLNMYFLFIVERLPYNEATICVGKRKTLLVLAVRMS